MNTLHKTFLNNYNHHLLINKTCMYLHWLAIKHLKTNHSSVIQTVQGHIDHIRGLLFLLLLVRLSCCQLKIVTA